MGRDLPVRSDADDPAMCDCDRPIRQDRAVPVHGHDATMAQQQICFHQGGMLVAQELFARSGYVMDYFAQPANGMFQRINDAIDAKLRAVRIHH